METTTDNKPEPIHMHPLYCHGIGQTFNLRVDKAPSTPLEIESLVERVRRAMLEPKEVVSGE